MTHWQVLPIRKPAGVLVAKQPDAINAGEQQVAFHGKIRAS
jgi:hypothetical protein